MPNPYIAVTLQADTDILDAIAETAAKAPKLMATAVKRNLGRFKRTSAAYRRLTTEPDKPTYPLRWKSAKQRRFVMAKLRREGNLPYVRTHALVNAYDLIADTSEGAGVLTLVNRSPIARFVVGDDAQPFHLDTGWQQIAKEVVPMQEELGSMLVDTWFLVADPFVNK